jgi:Ca-activated chloride channel family protein
MAWHLMRPQWLWCLLPALVLALLLWRQRGRGGGWSGVIAPHLLPFLMRGEESPRRRALPPLLLLGWVLAAVAASGPSWKQIPQPVHRKQDALVLVLDLSYSMRSADLTPSRLDRARQKLLDLLARRREGQTGLIAYAGDAHIVAPLTDDTPTIANLLPALDPLMMPVPGSDPGAAVASAVELLRSAGVDRGTVLLVTDAVTESDAKEVERALHGSGARLAVLGVGTTTGAPLPLPEGGFLKDRSGAIVMPALEEQPLRELAAATGGRYLRMRVDDSDLDYLLAKPALPGTAQTVALERTVDAWEDQGYYLVLLLLPLALAAFRRGWVACLLPLLLVTEPPPAAAFDWGDLWRTPDQQGQQALRSGDAEAAAALFENRDWAGTAAYRSGDYGAAIEEFSHNEGADGWYNRGNALARAGRFDEAVEAYAKSLALQPERDDARQNLALVEDLLRRQAQQGGGDPSQAPEQGGQQNGDEPEQGQQQGQQQEQGQQQGQGQGQNQNQERGQSGNRQGGNPQAGSAGPQQPPPAQGAGEDRPEKSSPGEESASQQAQQSEERRAEREQHAAPAEEGEDGDQQAEARRQQQEVPGEPDGREQMVASQEEPQQRERDQAMEQWLRRVPDDPSGLLRQKFRYESLQRQRQGTRRDDESYW